MAHGGPDWSTGGQISTVHTIEDLGELAARLGSIVTFDRRGNVIWLDDFESGIERWETLAGTISWSTEHTRLGIYAAKLVTGATDGDTASFRTLHPIPVISRLGNEFSFSIDTDKVTVYLGIFMYDANRIRHNIGIKYEPATHTVYYRAGFSPWSYDTDRNCLIEVMEVAEAMHDRDLGRITPAQYAEVEALWMGAVVNPNCNCPVIAGPWVALSPLLYIPLTHYAFNTIKVVIDPAYHAYIRVMANGQLHQPTDAYYQINYLSTWVGFGYYDEVNICLETNEDAAHTAYVDSAIITQNEP